jgi:hypothetical protein
MNAATVTYVTATAVVSANRGAFTVRDLSAQITRRSLKSGAVRVRITLSEFRSAKVTVTATEFRDLPRAEADALFDAQIEKWKTAAL